VLPARESRARLIDVLETRPLRRRPENHRLDRQEAAVPATPADGPGFDTLAAPATAETRVQRSRFLAEAAPAADETAARAHLADVIRRHHDARHHCVAWRLGHGADLTEFRSDAGEPSGSAGEPILNALRAADVTDAVCVVARWFGGVKLGTGGLGRAYRECAELALADAPRRRVLLGAELDLSFPYPLQNTVAHLLDAHGARRTAEAYDDGVRWRVWVPADRVEAFRAAVESAGQGRLQTTTPD